MELVSAADAWLVVLLGEIIQMTGEGVKPVAMVARPSPVSMPAFCIFEYVYFARPDSTFEGTTGVLLLICLQF